MALLFYRQAAWTRGGVVAVQLVFAGPVLSWGSVAGILVEVRDGSLYALDGNSTATKLQLSKTRLFANRTPSGYQILFCLGFCRPATGSGPPWVCGRAHTPIG